MTQNGAIAPHGGTLVSRLVDGGERERLVERAQSMPRVKLDDKAQSDLEMIAVGAFSPLRGFMGSADHRSVVESMRLTSGLPWSIPICLQVGRAVADGLKEGTQIALVEERDHVLAVMDLAEKFTPDREVECEKVYRTLERAHPGVAMVLDAGEVYLAGEITVTERPDTVAFPEYHRDPAQTRALFVERGWRTIVAFQTRNPIHRADEYITKCALEMVDGLMVHPIVGNTASEDIPAEVRMRCYEVLIAGYYPKDRVVLSAYPAAMRHAGPREAIFHAITRKNYGCTHFIVGRDHASVGTYYGSYDAQKIFDELAPGELGITPLRYDNAFFSKVTGQMATAKTAPGGPDTHVSLNGTKVRDMLRAGELPPPELSRPEVVQILIESMRAPGGNA